MSQYCVQMAAVFPSAEAADTFAEEVQNLISLYPKHDGTTVMVVLNSRGEGMALLEKAKKLGGTAEVKVVGEHD